MPPKRKMSRTQAKKSTTNYSKNSLKIDLNQYFYKPILNKYFNKFGLYLYI